jgi:NagD protein
LSNLRPVNSFLVDMDGVLVRGETPIEGAAEFIDRLRDSGKPFLLFTNNSKYSQEAHSTRLSGMNLNIPAKNIYTAAMATAQFLINQNKSGSAFVIGESGLFTPLQEMGYTLTKENPDYVVLGELDTYDFRAICKGVELIKDGAIFIATNPDEVIPGKFGIEPGCGAVAAMIEKASGKKPYFIGKPNPLMMRYALTTLEARAQDAAIIGDRMDTDVIAGLENGMTTYLVLSGVTKKEEIKKFPYRPTKIFGSVAEIFP